MAREIKNVPILDVEAQALFDALVGETDLAVATIGCAYLEQCLGALLKNRFTDCKVSKNLLEPGFGILGDYAARIHVAFALGLIPESWHDDLVTIGKIRNTFAHSNLTITFKNEEVTKWCNKLKNVKVWEETVRLLAGIKSQQTSRDYFCLSVGIYGQRLLKIAKSGGQPQVNESE
jgi:hypothetical protein